MKKFSWQTFIFSLVFFFALNIFLQVKKSYVHKLKGSLVKENSHSLLRASVDVSSVVYDLFALFYWFPSSFIRRYWTAFAQFLASRQVSASAVQNQDTTRKLRAGKILIRSTLLTISWKLSMSWIEQAHLRLSVSYKMVLMVADTAAVSWCVSDIMNNTLM